MESTAKLMLHGKSEDRLYQTKAVVVRLGFSKHTLETTLDPSKALSGGSISSTVFQFKSGKDLVTPALPVVMRLSSACVYFSRPGSKSGDFSRTIQIQFGDNGNPAGFSERVEIEPYFWASETCAIDGEGVIKSTFASTNTGPFQATITV